MTAMGLNDQVHFNCPFFKFLILYFFELRFVRVGDSCFSCFACLECETLLLC